MNAPATSIPSAVQFTDAAAARVKQMIADEGDDTLKLRVYIQGGGCSGFEYGFEFDKEARDDDTVVENAGVCLLIDPLSYQYLLGASIDYKEDLQGARFVLSNPNAKTTCGCGSSFSV
jgi:iron-sulfur cluster insertion protein